MTRIAVLTKYSRWFPTTSLNKRSLNSSIWVLIKNSIWGKHVTVEQLLFRNRIEKMHLWVQKQFCRVEILQLFRQDMAGWAASSWVRKNTSFFVEPLMGSSNKQQQKKRPDYSSAKSYVLLVSPISKLLSKASVRGIELFSRNICSFFILQKWSGMDLWLPECSELCMLCFTSTGEVCKWLSVLVQVTLRNKWQTEPMQLPPLLLPKKCVSDSI